MKDNIKETIKAGAHRPEVNPMFVPRVLNRLPECRTTRFWWILPLTFVVAFVLLIVYSAVVLSCGANFSDQLFLIASIALITLGLLYTFLSPLIRDL